MGHQVERLSDGAKPNSWILRLEGDVSIGTSGELRDALVKAAKECGHLVIDCSKLTAIDLAGIQLLCSLHLTLAAQKKTLGFAAPPPGFLAELVRKAGLTRTTGCRPECGECCLWSIGQ